MVSTIVPLGNKTQREEGAMLNAVRICPFTVLLKSVLFLRVGMVIRLLIPGELVPAVLLIKLLFKTQIRVFEVYSVKSFRIKIAPPS